MHEERYLKVIKNAVTSRGLAAVARLLGVNRSTVASVLVGRGRPCTVAAVRQAFVKNAAALEAM